MAKTATSALACLGALWTRPRLELESPQLTDLVEYALAKVALEDDFGAKLVARKGSIRRDLDLGL